tara:strand:+ start:238 stop:498 length:261 start_codon:yes stop_codon:yes gene_type:complete
MTVKTDKQALKDLMDIKDFESIHSKAVAYLAARQWKIYKDLEKWKAMSPSLSLEQEHIDSVIETQERHAEMFDYMYNVIINDKYDS